MVLFSTLAAPRALLHVNNAKRLKQCIPHVQFHSAKFP
jgi:hypothetical protein